MTNGKLFVCAFAAMSLVSMPRQASAIDRLTDDEMKKLFDTIEDDRSKFEGALDDKQKNTTIRGARGEVNANEFFDDFQDQVQRARDRFKSDYSASSEVLSLLQYATRLQGWTATQPAGFPGSKEWGVLATDLRRLASAYNTAMPNPGQQGLGSIAQARRINDAELVKAAANVEKKIDGFRTAYDSALAANTNITPETRQAAIQQVDAMKKNAQALNAALASDKEGVAEADALLKGTRGIIDTASKLPPSSPATVSWTPLRDDLATIALAYEVTPASK
jgi:hypothetical protein